MSPPVQVQITSEDAYFDLVCRFRNLWAKQFYISLLFVGRNPPRLQTPPGTIFFSNGGVPKTREFRPTDIICFISVIASGARRSALDCITGDLLLSAIRLRYFKSEN